MTRPYRIPFLRPLFLLFWRLRERDVDDVRFGETKGPPSYKYGKVTGLRPDLVVMSETGESPWVCCGYCSTGMVCRTAREGLANNMGQTAHPIRSQGGRPHDNGSRASELRAGAKSAHGVKLDPLAVDEIPGWLRDGYAVVVNLDYADLPDFLRVQGGSFGHSCALFGWREDGDYVGFFDPLWPQGARGAWAPWSQVRPALWADGEHSGTVTNVPPATPDPVPPVPPVPPEPDCPDCPPAVDEDAVRADAVSTTLLERDRAWRAVTGWGQPRYAGVWFGPTPGATPNGPARWSWFSRYATDPPIGSWNGDTVWDRDTWG